MDFNAEQQYQFQLINGVTITAEFFDTEYYNPDNGQLLPLGGTSNLIRHVFIRAVSSNYFLPPFNPHYPEEPSISLTNYTLPEGQQPYPVLNAIEAPFGFEIQGRHYPIRTPEGLQNDVAIEQAKLHNKLLRDRIQRDFNQELEPKPKPEAASSSSKRKESTQNPFRLPREITKQIIQYAKMPVPAFILGGRSRKRAKNKRSRRRGAREAS
jgi:hypothetical protein